MSYPEISEKQVPEQHDVPPWVPPTFVLTPRERLLLAWDRFGFPLICLVVAAVLVGLFLYAEDYLYPRKSISEPGVAEQDAEPIPGPVAVVSPETVLLTVTTVPRRAAILIDGDSVGVTPFSRRAVPAGRHVISIRKRDHVPVDTVIFLEGTSSSLLVFLKPQTPAAESLPEHAALARDSEGEGVVPGEGDPSPPTEVEESPSEPVAEPEISDVQATREDVDRQATESGVVPERVRVEEEVRETADTTTPTEEPATPRTGSVVVSSEPAGARVWVGGEYLGRTPASASELISGTHQVRIELDGYERFETDVSVEPGEQESIHAQLVRQMGVLRVLARPWGAIYIDGQLHKSESSVWYSVELPVGEHRVRVVHPMLGKWEQIVTVAAQKETPVIVDFNQSQGLSTDGER